MNSSELPCKNIFSIKHTGVSHKLANGEIRYVDVHTGNLQAEGKNLLYCIIHDITDTKFAEAKIQQMSLQDSVTGLHNRTFITEALTIMIQEAEILNQEIAVLYLDFDRFKHINDTLGHTLGDMVLKKIADKLFVISNDHIKVARLGGDEFIVLMSAVKGIEDVQNFADYLLKLFQEPISISGYELYTTASIGISLYPTNGDNAELLLINANIAMYTAKDDGRDTCKFYNINMDTNQFETFCLANDLRKAIKNNELTLYYQPQIDTKTNKIIGMEALLRWIHPVHGLIPPSEFIPLAEETGLIIPIGEWALKTACRQNKIWQEEGHSNLKVAVNISVIQFYHSEISNLVMSVLEETKLDPEYLELEITESITIRNIDMVKDVCKKLKSVGVSIAMDDFGTG